MSYTLDVRTASENGSALSGPSREIPATHWSWLFEQRAAQAPDELALVTESGSWSFAELELWSNRLARELCHHGVGPGNVVACALGRSVRAVIALLAVGKARGVYLPLDQEAPESRIRGIVADARPSLLVSDTDIPGAAEENIVMLDAENWRGKLIPHDATPIHDSSVGADLPAYIVYTSGTSGGPKGVVVGNWSLVNLYQEVARHLFPLVAHVDRPVRVPHGISLAFDAAWNPFLWMFGGHELHLLPDSVRKDAERYIRAVREQGFAVTESIPKLLEEMVEFGLLDSRPWPALVLFGGARVSQRLWTRLRQQPDLTGVNLYGPTECSVFSTWFRGDDGDEPLIGRPIANTHACVVDEAGESVECGDTGELWLGGAGVAERYVDRAELTEHRFRDGALDGAPVRWYRTGDRCRLRADGCLEFLGRADNQVKIRGHRVEPGEAEAVLGARPEVRSAVVLPEESEAQTRLVAYVVPTGGHPELVSTLRERLREQLPEYAVPARFELVDEMPVLPNGKVDVGALATRRSPDAGTARPRTGLEKSIAAVWAAALDIPDPDIHQDFFDLGGHSLLAARIALRLRADGHPCSIADVLRNPTVAALAECLQANSEAPAGQE